MARRAHLHDPELGALTDDRLTREVRVYQRLKGHRFSVDDVATAFVAARAAPEARSILDLGCGLGSVLLHLAWSLPAARLVGVEAQEISFALLRRNVERNGYSERVTIHAGDLREEQTVAKLGTGFDLVTGTPPYFPPDTALDADDEQRSYARVEYRGGVEAYLATAARTVSALGVVVLCGDARAEARVQAGAADSGLHLRARCDVIPSAGRPPLFSIWTAARRPDGFALSSLVIRDEAGQRTADAETLRVFSGF
jgi:tRNA1Val (adenine37-N6)-methyltransferase